MFLLLFEVFCHDILGITIGCLPCPKDAIPAFEVLHLNQLRVLIRYMDGAQRLVQE